MLSAVFPSSRISLSLPCEGGCAFGRSVNPWGGGGGAMMALHRCSRSHSVLVAVCVRVCACSSSRSHSVLVAVAVRACVCDQAPITAGARRLAFTSPDAGRRQFMMRMHRQKLQQLQFAAAPSSADGVDGAVPTSASLLPPPPLAAPPTRVPPAPRPTRREMEKCQAAAAAAAAAAATSIPAVADASTCAVKGEPQAPLLTPPAAAATTTSTTALGSSPSGTAAPTLPPLAAVDGCGSGGGACCDADSQNGTAPWCGSASTCKDGKGLGDSTITLASAGVGSPDTLALSHGEEQRVLRSRAMPGAMLFSPTPL